MARRIYTERESAKDGVQTLTRRYAIALSTESNGHDSEASSPSTTGLFSEYDAINSRYAMLRKILATKDAINYSRKIDGDARSRPIFGTEYYACQTVQFPGCTLFAQKWESSVEGSDRGRLTR